RPVLRLPFLDSRYGAPARRRKLNSSVSASTPTRTLRRKISASSVGVLITCIHGSLHDDDKPLCDSRDATRQEKGSEEAQGQRGCRVIRHAECDCGAAAQRRSRGAQVTRSKALTKRAEQPIHK